MGTHTCIDQLLLAGLAKLLLLKVDSSSIVLCLLVVVTQALDCRLMVSCLVCSQSNQRLAHLSVLSWTTDQQVTNQSVSGRQSSIHVASFVLAGQNAASATCSQCFAVFH